MRSRRGNGLLSFGGGHGWSGSSVVEKINVLGRVRVWVVLFIAGTEMTVVNYCTI